MAGGERPGEPYRQMVRLIDIRTRPEDYVLVWSGYSADVNFLSDRASPTRYAMQLALYSPMYGAGRVRQFLADLRAHPAALIIDASPSFGAAWGQAVPPIASATLPWGKTSATYRRAWDAVFVYLHANYQRDQTLPFYPNWIVYVPRG